MSCLCHERLLSSATMLSGLPSNKLDWMRPTFCLGAVTATLLAGASLATAGSWDLKLNRLCQIETTAGERLDCGGGYRRSMGDISTILADNAGFRAVMSELGVLFAPNVLAPAETFGYNGFTFAVELGFTSINRNRRALNQVPTPGNGVDVRRARYWRAASAVPDEAFAGGNILTEAAQEAIEDNLPSAFGSTITVMARKGLWLPAPSFEFGIGARHLIDSRMWSGILEAKWALHEGFQGWPVPAFAVRGMVSRVFGTQGFDLTVSGIDVSVSKHLGVASTFNLMPYSGYQLLWVVADSDVIDATPNIDAVGDSDQQDPEGTATQCRVPDCRANFTFDDQNNILRHRFFIGLRANFFLFSILAEYSFFAAGRTSDIIFEGTDFPEPNVRDQSGAQHSINLAFSVDY